MYFSEIYSIFFSRWLLLYFIPLREVGDLYAPPCTTLIFSRFILALGCSQFLQVNAVIYR